MGGGVKLIVNFSNYPSDRNPYLSERTDQSLYLRIIDLSNKERAVSELDEFARELKNHPDDKITIDGNEGRKWVIKCEENDPNSNCEEGKHFAGLNIADEQYLYQFSYFANPGITNGKDIFNQILSTFKFIPKYNISGWKTYKNEEYGFEFKYPQNWYEESVENPAPVGETKGKAKLLVDFIDYPSSWDCYHSKDCKQYRFTVLEKLKEFNLDELLNYEEREGGAIKEIVFGPEVGYKVISKGGFADDGRRILTAYFYIVKDECLYYIHSQSTSGDRFTERENIFDQIISTFRFLE